MNGIHDIPREVDGVFDAVDERDANAVEIATRETSD
jgi:hypothetical protein